MKYAEKKILGKIMMNKQTITQILRCTTQYRHAFALQRLYEAERTTCSAKPLHELHEVFCLQKAILQSFLKSQGFYIIS
jgi:hypothetical protein